MREGEAEDAEEDARIAHANIAEQDRKNRRGEHGAGEEKLHRRDFQILDQEGNCVRAATKKGRVAKREQAGIAQKQVEAERTDGGDEAVGQRQGLERIDDERCGEQ